MKRNLQLILVAGLLLLSSLFCSLVNPNSATAIPEPPATQSPLIESTAVPAADEPTPTTVSTGSISGTLSYPSEGIPPMRVVAFSTSDDTWFAVEINQGSTFVIEDIPAGEYTVVAYPLDKSFNGLAGGYSQFVPCGLSVECSDHSLIPVTVKAGEVTGDIRPADWYAPPDTFPPDPSNP